jgi:outer membrane protein assembly factor BamB
VLLTLALASGVLSASASRQAASQNPEGAPQGLLPAEAAWIVRLPAPPAAGGAMDDVRVYVPLQSGRLVALDRETGESEWSRELNSRSPALAVGGRLYVAIAGELQALDAATGHTIWRVPLAHEGAPLASGGGRLLVSTPTGLVAVDAAGGERVWARPLEATGALSSIVAGGQVVYAVSTDARVTALSLSSGETHWTHTLSGTLSPPAVARDRVFVGSSARTFYAFHAQSGRLEWRWRTGGDVMGAVADDDRVYLVTVDNFLRALNRGNGNQRWRRELSTRPVAPPVIVGGHVLVPGVSPALSAFETTTGTPVATYGAPGVEAGPSPTLQGSPLVDPVFDPLRVGCVLVMRDGRAVGLRPRMVPNRERPPVPDEVQPGSPPANRSAS